MVQISTYPENREAPSGGGGIWGTVGGTICLARLTTVFLMLIRFEEAIRLMILMHAEDVLHIQASRASSGDWAKPRGCSGASGVEAGEGLVFLMLIRLGEPA